MTQHKELGPTKHWPNKALAKHIFCQTKPWPKNKIGQTQKPWPTKSLAQTVAKQEL